ncbi:hypothetical protein BT96DRAFT_916912, partial [Gymnopus androsaceus JB14]
MSEYPPYKVLLKKIWHDIRPGTKLQWLALGLHLGLLFAFICPWIVSGGHITNLRPIRRSSGYTSQAPDLLTTIWLIGLVFLSTVTCYCLALAAVTAILHCKDWASEAGNVDPRKLLWRLRIVVYLVLIVTLNAVMAAVVKIEGTQTSPIGRPSINKYFIHVNHVPYYICLWVSIAISVLGATYFLGNKKTIH